MAIAGFQPRFIAPQELASFNLPSSSALPTIMNAVEAASKLIDEYCGRTDGDGNGSLVFSTYTERRRLESPSRNIFQTSFKPLRALSATDLANVQAIESASGFGTGTGYNSYYTGFAPNTQIQANTGLLSPLLSASGRYAYARRDSTKIYPDFNLGVNPLQVAGIFGGPPTWNNIDITQVDFDTQTGELWIPVGIYGYQYQEVQLQYNSGFDPTALPRSIKHACAAVIKNFLARGGGTTGVKALNASRINTSFDDTLIDSTVDMWLRNYIATVAF